MEASSEEVWEVNFGITRTVVLNHVGLRTLKLINY